MDAAVKSASRIVALGWSVILPCLNFPTTLVSNKRACTELALGLLARSDALLLLVGWKSDEQARIEQDAALRQGIPIFQQLRAVPSGADFKARHPFVTVSRISS